MTAQPNLYRAETKDIDAAIPEMVKMYEAGETTIAIAAKFRFSVETVRKRLVRAGVKMLTRGGVGRTNVPMQRPNVDRSGPLSEEEVQRLRKMVGFDLNRDVDIRRERAKRKPNEDRLRG